MTKHIWWLNHHAIPPVVPGGTRHFALAKSLEKRDFKTTVVNGSFDHLNSHFEENEEFGQNLKEPLLRSYEGVDFYSIPTSYYEGNASISRVKNMLSYYFGCMRYLKKNSIIQKPDIVIGSVVHPFAAYAGYRLSKYHKVPFIYEVRDLWPKSLVELGRISPKHPFVILLDKLDGFLAKRAKLIITTAPLMKNHYKENYHIPEERFLWITNGTDFINNAPSQMREIGKNETIRVAYTGVIGFANGIKDFLQELDKAPKEVLSRFNFAFIGDGPFKKEVQSYAQEKGLPVRFEDPVPKDKIWDIFQEYDFLLFTLIESPLFKYGVSPNKLADYHAAGRPIIEIVTCDSSPVQNSKAGYHISSFGELPQLLSKIIKTDPNEFLAMGAKGRIYAQEQYNWDNLAGKIEQNVRKII